MERGVVKIASDVKLVLCLIQEESERLKEATPFWIVEKILWVLILATLEECIHAKYGNPGVSSSWRHTESDKQTHSKPFTVTLSKGEGQLYHIHVHVLSDKHNYIYVCTCTVRYIHVHVLSDAHIYVLSDIHVHYFVVQCVGVSKVPTRVYIT